MGGTPFELIATGWPGFVGQTGRYNPKRALGSDLIAWWDADSRYWGANGAMTIATGVSSWKDIVGAYDATQGTGAAQPTFSATSFNGGPGVTFDGTDDALACTNATMLTNLPDGAEPGELWGLFSQDALAADTTTRRIFAYGANSNNNSRQLNRIVSSGTNRGQGLTGDGAAKTAAGTNVNLSSRHVGRWQIGASSSSLTIDGVAEASVSSVPSTTNTRLRIGALIDGAASNFHQGQIAAVLATLPLSASKAAALQAWLMSRRRL